MSPQSSLRISLIAIAVLFVLPVLVLGQTVTGTLQGTVVDKNGAFVPGAEVVVKNLETGQERTLQTNNDGFFVASYVQIGRYSISVTLKGFKLRFLSRILRSV